jgi:hypothetical protein
LVWIQRESGSTLLSFNPILRSVVQKVVTDSKSKVWPSAAVGRCRPLMRLRPRSHGPQLDFELVYSPNL